MYRCILRAQDGCYFTFDRNPSRNLDDALLFESRSDAEWTQREEFPDSEIITVWLDGDKTIPLPRGWLVISYKPSRADYCRSCYMGTYSSDHEMAMFTDEDKLVEHCAQLDANNEGLAADYRHWVLAADDIYGEYNNLNSTYGHMPTYLEKRIEARVAELKKAKGKK